MRRQVHGKVVEARGVFSSCSAWLILKYWHPERRKKQNRHEQLDEEEGEERPNLYQVRSSMNHFNRNRSTRDDQGCEHGSGGIRRRVMLEIGSQSDNTDR